MREEWCQNAAVLRFDNPLPRDQDKYRSIALKMLPLACCELISSMLEVCWCRTKLTKIEDWSDLMHPSLKNRISFLDSPREFFGVTLKTLGMGYNSSPFELKSQNITEDVLTRRIHDLRDQVLVFSNRWTSQLTAY